MTCDPLLTNMLGDLKAGRESAPLSLGAITAFPQGMGTSWLRLHSRANAPKSSGKYLFFATDPRVLLALACEELAEHGFCSAKVSTRPGAHAEHALCLYWEDDSRAAELQARHPEVKFRGFKTDAATRAGLYSPEFLAARAARQQAGEVPNAADPPVSPAPEPTVRR